MTEEDIQRLYGIDKEVEFKSVLHRLHGDSSSLYTGLLDLVLSDMGDRKWTLQNLQDRWKKIGEELEQLKSLC